MVFPLACKDCEEFSKINSRLRFFFLLLFNLEVSSRTPISLLGQDHPTVAQRAETTMADCSLTICLWARFPGRFPRYACMGSIVSPFRLHWVKGVCVFRLNLPPALLADWPGSFTCHCGNTGVERTPNKSQHRKLTPEKKPPLPLLLRPELAIFRWRIWHWPASYPGSPARGLSAV